MEPPLEPSWSRTSSRVREFLPFDLAAVDGAVEFYAFDGANYGLFRSTGPPLARSNSPPISKPRLRCVTAPPPGFSRDFNGDGFSDILWQNTSGQAAIWELDGTSQIAGAARSAANPGPSWTEVGSGDFNGDGHSDILWQNANGQAAIWETKHQCIGGGSVGANPGPSWRAVGTGDFNGDGLSDILWQNTTGRPRSGRLTGLTDRRRDGRPNRGRAGRRLGRATSTATAIPTFCGRTPMGRSRSGKRTGAAWLASASVSSNPGRVGSGRDWRLQRRRPFRHPVPEFGQRAGCDLGNGRDGHHRRARWSSASPGSSWHAIRTGDFNGDGHSDILWQNASGQAGDLGNERRRTRSPAAVS